MSRSERMSLVDTTWLRMDRTDNPMMIVAVWILEGPVAVDKVEKQIADGLMSYRRCRQKIEYAPAGAHWRDDFHFDLAHHVKRMKPPGRGGKRELERFVGEVASEAPSRGPHPARAIPPFAYAPFVRPRSSPWPRSERTAADLLGLLVRPRRPVRLFLLRQLLGDHRQLMDPLRQGVDVLPARHVQPVQRPRHPVLEHLLELVPGSARLGPTSARHSQLVFRRLSSDFLESLWHDHPRIRLGGQLPTALIKP